MTNGYKRSCGRGRLSDGLLIASSIVREHTVGNSSLLQGLDDLSHKLYKIWETSVVCCIFVVVSRTLHWKCPESNEIYIIFLEIQVYHITRQRCMANVWLIASMDRFTEIVPTPFEWGLDFGVSLWLENDCWLELAVPCVLWQLP